MQFGIRHLLGLMVAVAIPFAVFDRVEVARRAHRAEVHYAIAKSQNDRMRDKLDATFSDWRTELEFAPKFEDLPESPVRLEDMPFTGTIEGP